jgi:hypothetical protein
MMEKFNEFLECVSNYVSDDKLLIGFACGFLVGTLLRCFDL